MKKELSQKKVSSTYLSSSLLEWKEVYGPKYLSSLKIATQSGLRRVVVDLLWGILAIGIFCISMYLLL